MSVSWRIVHPVREWWWGRITSVLSHTPFGCAWAWARDRWWEAWIANIAAAAAARNSSRKRRR